MNISKIHAWQERNHQDKNQRVPRPKIQNQAVVGINDLKNHYPFYFLNVRKLFVNYNTHRLCMLYNKPCFPLLQSNFVESTLHTLNNYLYWISQNSGSYLSQ